MEFHPGSFGIPPGRRLHSLSGQPEMEQGEAQQHPRPGFIPANSCMTPGNTGDNPGSSLLLPGTAPGLPLDREGEIPCPWSGHLRRIMGESALV